MSWRAAWSTKVQKLLGESLRCASAIGLSLIGAACGEDAPSQPPDNPLPVLLAVEPALLYVGGEATQLTLSGSGFVQGSQVRWNGADRMTRYRTPQSLSVDLLASDLTFAGRGTLVVVNGAPGGGTSGTLDLEIGYPKPTVTSLSPNRAFVQWSFAQAALRLTITGTGFGATSSIRLGGSFLSPTTVSPTQIVVDVPASVLATPGVRALVVGNPPPGGGFSDSVSFTVTYPTPRITAISPDSTLTGVPMTLTIDGTGFTDATVVRWNGANRPTSVQSATRILTTVEGNDAARSTTASVTVYNPAPDGGTSNAVAFRVRDPAPRIVSIDPGTIPAGSVATTVTIRGLNFASDALVRLDGAFRIASFSNSTTMSVTLPASDLAVPRVAALTVTNPGESGVSNAAALAVLAPGATMSVARVIDLPHTDIVYDAGRAMLYASVPAGASQFANSLVRIDPTTGTVTGAIAVGSDPQALAISDDGAFVYVALGGTPRVARVATGTFAKDLELALPTQLGAAGVVYAEDLETIPGSPRSVAVSISAPNVTPRHVGVVVFDDSTRRDSIVAGYPRGHRITRGPSPLLLLG